MSGTARARRPLKQGYFTVPENPAEPPKLTMEQYASLNVDLQSPHADAAAVLRRYGLTPETKRTTDGWFSALFQRDPEKQASFHRACAAYKAWLASGSSPRKP